MNPKIFNNPFYKPNNKQTEITTQDVRNDDVLVNAPKVRRKRKAKVNDEREATSRYSLSQENVGDEVQEATDLS